LYPTPMHSTTRIPHEAAVVLTTLAAEADAAGLARTLVEERLAACVNVLPVMTSVYRWKGDIEQDREQQLVIKTSAERVEALRARLRELHPYELPEFIVLDAAGSEAYLAWIAESTT
jgi:periplasmic divalent cation tolerance protein